MMKAYKYLLYVRRPFFRAFCQQSKTNILPNKETNTEEFEITSREDVNGVEVSNNPHIWDSKKEGINLALDSQQTSKNPFMSESIQTLLNFYETNSDDMTPQQYDQYVTTLFQKAEIERDEVIRKLNLIQTIPINDITNKFLSEYNSPNTTIERLFAYLHYVYFIDKRKYNYLVELEKRKEFIDICYKALEAGFSKFPIDQLLNISTMLGYYRNLSYYRYVEGQLHEIDTLGFYNLNKVPFSIN